MEKVKIKAISSIVAQFRENSEIDVIMDEGIMYVPHYAVVGETHEVPDKPEKAEAKKPTAKKEKVSKKPVDEVDDDDDEEETPAPKKGKKEADAPSLKKQIEAVVTDFDSGDLIQAKATAKLVELTEKSKKEIDKILTAFDEDEDAEISACVKQLMPKKGAVDEDDENDEEPAPKTKSKKAPVLSKKGKKEKRVELDDLEKGQNISVYWGTDPEDGEVYNEWFKGTVQSVKGGVKIKWADDGSVSDFDEELMEDIKLVDEDDDDEDE